MLVNYLKIAFRTIGKHKLFTCINVAGLAMSMSLGLLIVTLVSDLLSYDNFHDNTHNIYRITTSVQFESGISDIKATCPFPVADNLGSNYQGYRNIVRIQRFFKAKCRTNNKEIELEGYFTEPSFLKMFSFELLKGNMNTALQKPNSIILTKGAAERLFGEEDPIGKMLSTDQFGEYAVTGVINNPPVNSHLKFEMLGSLSGVPQVNNSKADATAADEWNELFKNYVYIEKLPGISENQISNDLQMIAKKGNAILKDRKLDFQLQPLSKIVPGPDLSSQIGPKMSYLPIFILSGIVLLILVSACINYTNLSLARALRRAKEVGIRKAIGGSRKQLFIQFLTETIVVSLVSLVAAYFIFNLIKPHFLRIVPRANEMFTLAITPYLAFIFVAFAFFTALLAGILPASVLSRFNAIKALKSDTTIKALGRLNMRKALIVFQFTLSMIFIIGVIVIYRQFHFTLNYDHGFSTEKKVIVPMEGFDYSIFKNEFERNPDIISVTGSSTPVGGFQTNATRFTLPGKADSLSADYLKTDQNFIRDLKIELLAGSGFNVTSKSREHSIIINEQMAHAIGARQPGDAVGKVVIIDNQQWEVIGVVNDFNYAHLEEPIRSFAFFFEESRLNYAYLTLAGKFNDDVRISLYKSWSRIAGKIRFEGKPMEVYMEETYSFYLNFFRMFGFVALLTITIGCLGLIGISLYAAESRIKEVGIRKAMGASLASILILLSKGFVWLLIISSAISLPLGYLLFNQVLSNGSYHITIGFIELGSGALILLLVGGITILSQTVKIASLSPVESLKNE